MAGYLTGVEHKVDRGKHTFLYEMSSGSAKLQIKSSDDSGSSFADVTDSSKSASDQITIELYGSSVIKAVLTGDAVCYLLEK